MADHLLTALLGGSVTVNRAIIRARESSIELEESLRALQLAIKEDVFTLTSDKVLKRTIWYERPKAKYHSHKVLRSTRPVTKKQLRSGRSSPRHVPNKQGRK
jgi:hypothetical protein